MDYAPIGSSRPRPTDAGADGPAESPQATQKVEPTNDPNASTTISTTPVKFTLDQFQNQYGGLRRDLNEDRPGYNTAVAVGAIGGYAAGLALMATGVGVLPGLAVMAGTWLLTGRGAYKKYNALRNEHWQNFNPDALRRQISDRFSNMHVNQNFQEQMNKLYGSDHAGVKLSSLGLEFEQALKSNDVDKQIALLKIVEAGSGKPINLNECLASPVQHGVARSERDQTREMKHLTASGKTPSHPPAGLQPNSQQPAASGKPRLGNLSRRALNPDEPGEEMTEK